jgi:hypothetical protein
MTPTFDRNLPATGACPWLHPLWQFLHKLLQAAGKVPGLGRWLEHPRGQALRDAVLARYVAGLPDRRYWDTDLMPTLVHAGFQTILFVGCEPYTRRVHEQFEQAGIECWTTDINPLNFAWGNPRHHLVADIADIRRHVPDNRFDAVLFNGVMGYGVTGAHMTTIAPALHAILRDGGLLLVGWNKGLVEDPLTLEAVTARFAHGPWHGLPARSEFSDSTHVYDLFTKAPLPPAPPAAL